MMRSFPRRTLRQGGVLFGCLLVFTTLCVASSVGIFLERAKFATWLQIILCSLIAVGLPLPLGDNLLSRFGKSFRPEQEIRWLLRTTLAVHLLLLGAAFQYGGLSPRDVFRFAKRSGQSGFKMAKTYLRPETKPEAKPEPKKPRDLKETLVAPRTKEPTASAEPVKPQRQIPIQTVVRPPEVVRPPKTSSGPKILRPPRSFAARPRLRNRRFTPNPVSERVRKLAQEITQGASGDLQKAQAVHDWVAKHIRYDVPMLRSGQLRSVTPEEVLDTRKGVCSGYATLTKALFDALGMEAKVTSGWARHNDETWEDLLRRASPTGNHAWNEVLVDGRWLVMDTTWDAGYVEGDTFHPRVSQIYFDPEPSVFARDHSITKPTTRPANASDYYFLMPPDKRKPLQEKAFKQARKLTKHRGKLWGGKVTGKIEGSAVYGLALIQTKIDDYGKDCKSLRFRWSGGEWVYEDASSCPKDGNLPTGGFDPPAWFQ